MSVTEYFSSDYAEAREKFTGAARAAGAELERFINPEKGPKGEDLSTDIAWLGPRDADKVLVTMSATHGAEGFCGSGVQVGWFRSGRATRLPANTALLQIHAINPYGFAWLRRTNEDNVDLNRNFVDFDQPLPVNDGYVKYQDIICPKNWSDEIAEKTSAEIDRLIDELPPLVMQGAVSSGQYVDANGVFYGGTRPTWSRKTIEAIIDTYLSKAKRVAIIDYHTGLGPRGYGERIGDGGAGNPSWDRAQDWWGDLTSSDDGSSTSAPLHGTNLNAMAARMPNAEVTAIALEYGTRPLHDVLLAVRSDAWLHAYGDLNSDQGRAIKAFVRDAFYQDADDWKQMIWSRGIDTQEIALARVAD